jgi:hypothetical protein
MSKPTGRFGDSHHQQEAQMNKHQRFGMLLVIALIASLALTASAPAAKLGGKTTLAPKQATFDSLAAAGVAVAPSGAADASSGVISFPITGGRFNADDVVGKIGHKGGLTFSDGHTALTVKNFVVKVGAKNVIRAEVAGGGHVRLAKLDLDKAKVGQRGGKVVISNVGVLLAGKAANALSATFGLPDLEGADLGTAKVKVKP